MGKDLKGKECGKGLSQRKDKKYSARYVTRLRKRIEKYFDTLPEARNWLADARYEDMHSGLGPTSTMTVDSWFNYWFDKIIFDLSPNTRRNYKERYERNIQPVIGRMCMVDVKPMHCKIILNRMMRYTPGQPSGRRTLPWGPCSAPPS